MLAESSDTSNAAARSHSFSEFEARKARLFALVLASPGLFFLLVDIVRRPERVFTFDFPHALGYWATSLIATAMWAALLFSSTSPTPFRRHVAGGIFATLFAFSFGIQAAFFYKYNVYSSYDATYYSVSFPLAILGSLPLGVGLTWGCVAGAAALGILMLRSARNLTLSGRTRSSDSWIHVLAAGLVAIGFALPISYRASIQSSSPALIYFHSLSYYVNLRFRAATHADKLTLVRVQRRFPETVPPIAANPARKRNVLFVLQESQRADVTCIAYHEKCELSNRATNALLPKRFPFLQMRSAASSTAVAISNLWAGVDPMESYALLHSTPLIWEYAAAAGYDTAYWTSQNLIFGNARLYVQDLPLSHLILGTNLDPECDTLVGAADEKLSDHVIAHWDELREPFFAVVHYSNLHRPRLVDPKQSPFKPSSGEASVRSKSGKNFYRNAVYLSDLAVAKLIRHIQSTEQGERTVIVYTSDHGEALLEHHNENDHSSTVFDEEVHVPTWIDGPQGTLAPEEVQSLQQKSHAYLVQYDIAATLLDLLGIWSAPEFAPFRGRVIGEPMTRPELYEKPVPLTNVSWVWEYHEPNWGMMQGPLKVVALTNDERYRCYDVEQDPEETMDLGEESCPELVRAAKERFSILPKDMPLHMRSRPDIFGPWPPAPPP